MLMELETRTLGRTALTVSRFGAGGHFTNGPLAHEDISRRVRELNHILDLGVTYIDVQWDPEELATAEIMKSRKEDFTVAWPLHGMNKQTPEAAGQYVKAYCDDHRQRYGVEHVDILLWVGLQLDEETGPDLLDAAGEAFQAVREEGFCDHFAFSCHHSPQMARGAVGHDSLFDVMMVPYSPLHPGAGRELLPAARERGVGTVAMKNFGGGGGFLNQVWAGQANHPAGEAWRDSPRPYQSALCWVLRDDNVDCAVPAAHSLQQIDELHQAILAGPQSDDDEILEALRQAMDETSAEVQLRGKIAADPGAWD